MKRVKNVLFALLLVPALAWSQEEGFQEVSMSSVPERVARTATSARSGAYITRIIRELDNDNLQYKFYASQVGRYWVIVVRDDGELLEVYESPSAPPALSKSEPED